MQRLILLNRIWTHFEKFPRRVIVKYSAAQNLYLCRLEDFPGYAEYRDLLLKAKPEMRRYLWLSRPNSVVELAKFPERDIWQRLEDYMANFPYGLPDPEFIQTSRMLPQIVMSLSQLADNQRENPYGTRSIYYDVVFIDAYGLLYYMMEDAIPDKRRRDKYVDAALSFGQDIKDCGCGRIIR